MVTSLFIGDGLDAVVRPEIRYREMEVMKTNTNILSQKAMIAVIMSVIILPLNFVWGQEKVLDVESFRKEALKEWKGLLTRMDSYTCVRKVVSYNQLNEKIQDGESFSAVLLPCCITEESADDEIRVVGYNKSYCFELAKNEGEWKIHDIKEIKEKADKKKLVFERPYANLSQRRDNGFYRIENLSGACVLIYSELSLPYLFTDPDFKISNVRELVDDFGRSYIRFDFAYPADKEENKLRLETGSIELNKQHYSLKRVEYLEGINKEEAREFVITFEYDVRWNETFPFLTKRNMTAYWKGEMNWSVNEEFDYKVDDLTEDRFKLSYYGFEEPVFENDFNLDTRWYFLIVGLALVAVATLLSRLRKRVCAETTANNETTC